MGILRSRVDKCRVHGNARPCFKCARVDRKAAEQAQRTGVDPRPRPCPKCGKTMRGGVCPGAFC